MKTERFDNPSASNSTPMLSPLTELLFSCDASSGVISDNEFLLNIIDVIPDPLFVKDEGHRWLLLNDAFCKFMGRDRKELIGKSDYDFFPQEQADVFWEKDNEVLLSGEENINEEVLTDADHVDHIISTKKSVFIDPRNGSKYLVGVIRDYTDIRNAEVKLKKALKKLEEFSYSDSLTQLANRRYLMTIADHQMRLAKRMGKDSLLIFIDIDNLKMINDQLGHDEGDRAIIETANILKETFRESDVIARIGGDEFVVLSIGVTEESGRSAIMRLNRKIDERNTHLNDLIKLSVSTGCSCSSQYSEISISELLACADREMYRQKLAKKRHH